MKLHSVRKLALLSGVFAGALASTAQAQTSPAQIEELVVTAQKRAENVQDVPLSITAVSGAELEKAHIFNFAQLTTLVPSLQFSVSNNVRNATVSLRGIGQSGNNPGIESSVGVFIDGVYVPGPSALLGDLADTQSVEVLNGPQGTLYGRNTPLGAINIVTRAPQAAPEAQLTVGYGNYDQMYAKGYVGGELAPNLVARASFWGRDRSGFAYNLMTKEHVNDFAGAGGRVRAVWTPTDSLKLDLVGYYSNVTAKDGVSDVVDAAGPFGVATPGYLAATAALGYTFQNYNGLDFVVQTQDVTNDTARAQGLALTGTWDFGEGYTLTSITSGDFNLGAADPYGNAALPQKVIRLVERGEITSYSQELRLASPTDGRLQYIAGLYAYRQMYDFKSRITVLADANRLLPLPAALGGPQRFVAGDTEYTAVKLNTASEAAFGTAWLKITDLWTLQVGGRQVWEHKDGHINHINSPGTGAAFRFAFGPNPVGPVSRTEKKFTWLVSTQYKLTPDVMVFATASTGWKSGGFNARLIAPGIPVEFGSESSKDYAVGIKSELFDRRLRLNLTAFDIVLENFQSSILNPVTRSGFITGNAGARETRGVEGDFAAVLGDNFRLSGGLTWLDAEYTDYANGPCYTGKASNGSAPGTCTFNGLTPDRSPKLKGNLAASYAMALGDAFTANARAEIQHTASLVYDAALDPQTTQKAVTLLNASLDIAHTGGHWSVNIWGRNLTDEHYYQSMTATPVVTLISTGGTAGARGYSGYYADPRTYGVEVTYRY